jgi:CubicO group peptidase (beta-lactamase class C family)
MIDRVVLAAWRAVVLTLCLVVALSPLGCQPAEGAPNVEEPLWAGGPTPEAIDTYVAREMARHGIAGLAVTVIHGDDIAYRQGFGLSAPGRPAEPETPFYIGSVSKTFTSLAVMQLVDAGLLDLDAPVREYLPWFAVADPVASAEITPRHLLTHTSGLTNASLRGRRLPPDATIEDTVRLLREARPEYPVGTTHAYFNPNYNVLAHIVEVISGRDYETYVEQAIFAPLGLQNAYTRREEGEQDGLAQGHIVVLGLPVPRRQPHLAHDVAAGFLMSSAEDLGRYAIALLQNRFPDGEPLLSTGALGEMWTVPEGIDSQYALGWIATEQRGEPGVWHDGSLEAFWSILYLLPERKVAIAVVANTNGIAHLTLGYPAMTQGLLQLVQEGQSPGDGVPVRLLYGALAVAMLLTLAWAVQVLRRSRRWLGRERSRRSPRALAPEVARVVVGVVLLVGLPLAVLGTWQARVLLLYYLFDVAAWLMLLAVLLLTTGLVRICWWLTEHRGRHPGMDVT